uniref:Retrovirus-related Pol polyprotein from transposon RE1 n=1 Tax=Vitis vinifera TaxID=29760 RepID=A5AIH3_VITVI|nr:hypothetical protein VITISV_035396 [Vitis vinifera]
MTTPNGTPILPTTNESQLLTINTAAQAPLKLTSSNYLSWKIQFETLFIGYDLLGYIDGSKPCPPKTLTTNNVDTLNPAYTLWIRQDQLILNALIGSLSPTIISFIARANTSREAWTILANTYVKPSRGRIKQVKNLLKNPSKGTMTVTDFLHSVKARTDELAILGAPMEEEDLTEKILDGLGDEYKELVRAVQARDTSISFDELHEKPLSFEASLLANTKSEVNLPITANPTNRNNPMNTNWRPHKTNTNWHPNHSNSPGNIGWRPPATFPTRPPMATHSGTPSRINRLPPSPVDPHFSHNQTIIKYVSRQSSMSSSKRMVHKDMDIHGISKVGRWRAYLDSKPNAFMENKVRLSILTAIGSTNSASSGGVISVLTDCRCSSCAKGCALESSALLASRLTFCSIIQPEYGVEASGLQRAFGVYVSKFKSGQCPSKQIPSLISFSMHPLIRIDFWTDLIKDPRTVQSPMILLALRVFSGFPSITAFGLWKLL